MWVCRCTAQVPLGTKKCPFCARVPPAHVSQPLVPSVRASPPSSGAWGKGSGKGNNGTPKPAPGNSDSRAAKETEKQMAKLKQERDQAQQQLRRMEAKLANVAGGEEEDPEEESNEEEQQGQKLGDNQHLVDMLKSAVVYYGADHPKTLALQQELEEARECKAKSRPKPLQVKNLTERLKKLGSPEG